MKYGYDVGGSSSNEIRPTTLTYPNGRVVTYNYASGMDSTLNRITSLSDTSATLASYTYLGTGTVVRITYPQPSVWLDLWGGTAGTFAGLDRFNRITDQRWQNAITTAPADIDRYQYGYDRNSNRLYKANVVGTAAVSSGLDEYYAYDPLNRLTKMQRGVLNGTKTGITGTPAKEQDWTLDATGNWSGYLTKTSGTTDLNQTRTANKVNEITAIGGTPAWATPPAYDPAGNMTSFPQSANPSSSFTATYDAWNRMTSISASGSTVATYQYDGRNRRTVKVTAATSETRHFYFTNTWQDIEERVGTATTMDQQYVWGIRYIDELVCRDDATATPARRLYATQDANFNLTCITDTSGAVVERYVYEPYGTRAIYSPTWASRSASSYAWVVGRQGLISDIENFPINIRHRNYSLTLGLWQQRDLLTYFDSANIYEAFRSSPTRFLDPYGLAAECSPERFDQLSRQFADSVENGSSPEERAMRRYLEEKRNGTIPFKSLDDLMDEESDKPTGSPEDLAMNQWIGECYGDCISACRKSMFGGESALGALLFVGGIPIGGTKRFVTQGSSAGTSLLGRLIPSGSPIGVRMWAPTLRVPLSITTKLGRFASRWAPYIGLAMTMHDLSGYMDCLKCCKSQKSIYPR